MMLTFCSWLVTGHGALSSLVCVSDTFLFFDSVDQAILAKCTHLQALQPLLRDAPMKVQKYVLRQFAQLLPHDVEARRAFVQSGGLQFLQELNETVGGKLSEFILQINNCYPPEVVEYYSPNYSKTLLQKIDEYQPAM